MTVREDENNCNEDRIFNYISKSHIFKFTQSRVSLHIVQFRNHTCFSCINISWVLPMKLFEHKVRKGAHIRNRYNQIPHLTQNNNMKVTNSQLYTTNESQEVSPFPAGDYKAQINRRTQRQSKHKPEKYKRFRKEIPPWNGQ